MMDFSLTVLMARATCKDVCLLVTMLVMMFHIVAAGNVESNSVDSRDNRCSRIWLAS